MAAHGARRARRRDQRLAETDLCYANPSFGIDLFVVCQLRSLTSAWMGHTSFEQEIQADNITLIGHEVMARTLTRWLKRSSFAESPKQRPELNRKISA